MFNSVTHTLKGPCWRRPQGHYFSITKTSSKRLCTRYCWINMVCRRSGWSSSTGDWTQMRAENFWPSAQDPTVAVPEVQEEVRKNGVETEKNRDTFSNYDNHVTCVDLHCCLLFRNWIEVVRFVSQEVGFDKGFVNWYFLNYCFDQIMSLWSPLGIGVWIIFTSNEWVDRISNLKSNTSQGD